MGGEPLCPANIGLVKEICYTVRRKIPNIKIYIWTGYIYEELKEYYRNSIDLRSIFKIADILIDGPYINEERDITLAMRGSRNQRIINLKTGEIYE